MDANRDHFVCPLCQAENRANAKFCRLCGQPRLSLDKTFNKALDKSIDQEIQVAIVEEIVNSPSEKASQKLEQIQANNKSTLCTYCQVQIRSTDNFCCWCGKEHVGKTLADCLYCPKCEKRLPAQANFCFACGVHVGPHKRLKLRPPGDIFQAEEEEFFPTFDA